MQAAVDGTRARILETALRLFNEEGATRISTNRIASEMGISPGNLHYHFHSRRDIVRAHFQALVDEHQPLWTWVVPGEFGLMRMIDLWFQGIKIEYRYRYFYRDFHSLSREDPELRAIHRKVFEERRGRVELFIDGCRERGVLIDLDEKAGRDVNLAAWLVQTMWMPFLDVMDTPVSDQALLEGIRICIRAVEPHVHPEIRPRIWQYFNDFAASRK